MFVRKETLEEKIFRIRYTAHSGSAIPQHHSMRRAHFTPELILSFVLIPVLLDFLLIHYNPQITQLWQFIFEFWMDKLSLPGDTGIISFPLFGIDINVAYLDVAASAPTNLMWWSSYFVCAVIFLLTFFMGKDFLPLSYFLRLVVFIIFTTHIFFMIKPDFTYDVASLVAGSLRLSYELLLLMPWIMALTYNIFDFSFLKKVLISFIVVGYLTIFLPFQYTMHCLIVNKMSLLFLPVLYLIFGSFMDIYVFISLYSWGLSWKRKKYVPVRG